MTSGSPRGACVSCREAVLLTLVGFLLATVFVIVLLGGNGPDTDAGLPGLDSSVSAQERRLGMSRGRWDAPGLDAYDDKADDEEDTDETDPDAKEADDSPDGDDDGDNGGDGDGDGDDANDADDDEDDVIKVAGRDPEDLADDVIDLMQRYPEMARFVLQATYPHVTPPHAGVAAGALSTASVVEHNEELLRRLHEPLTPDERGPAPPLRRGPGGGGRAAGGAKTDAVVRDDEVSSAERQRQLIADVLANGAPSSRPRRGSPSLALRPVPRVVNISCAEFEKWHAAQFGLQPVVIERSQTEWYHPEEWTFDAIRDAIGDVPLRRQSKKCGPDAKLEVRDGKNCHSVREPDPALRGKIFAALRTANLTELKIDTYGDLLGIQKEYAKNGRFLYAFDIANGRLPRLQDAMRIPRYFLNELRDVETSPSTTPEDLADEIHFPSFMMGAGGSASLLHSDGSMTRFWLHELAGRKLLRMFPPTDNWRAKPSDSSDWQPSMYTVDLMAPDFTAFPDMDGMIVYEALLHPGDVLFIPEGWGHQALNLEWTAMVTANYIDANNLPSYLLMRRYDNDERKDYKPSNETLDRERELNAFWLPMHDPYADKPNMRIMEYATNSVLGTAPVSVAAREYIAELERREVPPWHWTDRYSVPVLIAAIEANYVALARWLITDKGLRLPNRKDEAALVALVEDSGSSAMLRMLREALLTPAHGTPSPPPPDADDEDYDDEKKTTEAEQGGGGGGGGRHAAPVEPGARGGGVPGEPAGESAQAVSGAHVQAAGGRGEDARTGAGRGGAGRGLVDNDEISWQEGHP